MGAAIGSPCPGTLIGEQHCTSHSNPNKKGENRVLVKGAGPASLALTFLVLNNNLTNPLFSPSFTFSQLNNLNPLSLSKSKFSSFFSLPPPPLLSSLSLSLSLSLSPHSLSMGMTQHSTATSSDQEPEMGAPKNQSLSCGKHGKKLGSLRRANSRKQRDLKKLQQKRQKDVAVVAMNSSGLEEDDGKAEVERKIATLQRIVPGGADLGVDKLFEETAGYILVLQGQVKAMRALANFFEGLEKEKRKLGG